MASAKHPRRRGGRILAFLIIATIAPAAALPAAAAPTDPGELTSRNAMLDVIASGGWAKPIITVGEEINGYTFEAIPDGISIWNKHGHTVEVFVNHETSTVSFPLQAEGEDWEPETNTTTSGPTPGTQNDFNNSQLSHLVLNRKTAGVLSAEMVIDTEANYQRFCSQFLADRKAGFERPILFMNEEATDFVSRTGDAYPALPATEPPNEQAGVVVAYDVQTGDYKTIYGMGRLNHENSLALPGYGAPTVLTTDDTFSSNPPSSQLYMYRADSAAQLWDDEGTLYGFRATDSAAFDDYYDFAPGSTTSISGEFVEISETAAKGAQAGLESESDAKSVFQFVRLEDVAYDRAHPNIVYIADTGRGSGAAPNGRIWKMVLNKKDPQKVDSLSVLYDGDTSGLGIAGVIHQPDNVETTKNYLYVTEDPSSGNQGANTARVWQIRLKGVGAGTAQVVAQVNQAYDGEPGLDVDGFADAGPGYWEASGIIDVSDAFGAGTFLVTVQAHSLWVDKEPADDNWTRTGGNWTPGEDGHPDWMNKREGGQLLLIKIPGG